MSGQTFQPGELVRAVIDGARVEVHDGDGLVLILGGYARVVIPTVLPSDPALVKVERVAPPGWPGWAGDRWVTASPRQTWMTGDLTDGDTGPYVPMLCTDGRSLPADDVLRFHGPVASYDATPRRSTWLVDPPPQRDPALEGDATQVMSRVEDC